jgi:HK97 family phage major capsid protein
MLENARKKLRELLDESQRMLDAAQAKGAGHPDADEREALNAKLVEVREIEATISTLEAFEETRERIGQPVEERVDAGEPVNNDNFEVSLGEFLQAVARQAPGSMPGTQIGGRECGVPTDHDMRILYGSPEERQKREQQRATGASESVPSEGGFLVGTDFSDQLMQKVHDTGVLQKYCSPMTISARSNALKIKSIDETSRANGSRWGGIRAYWVDEGGTLTATKPKFRDIQLTLNKLAGLAYATDELLEDAAALGQVFSNGFAEEMGFKIDDAIYNGDGSGKPQGILNANCTVSISKESGQAAATIDPLNIVKMYARLWARSRPNARWFANQDIIPKLFTMVLSATSTDVPMYLPANQLAGRPFNTLLGLPIEFIEQAATLGTVGDIMLADLSQYIFATKAQMRSAQSMHVQFTTDEMAFRFILRVDGQPLWNNALTPFKGTNSQTPFLSLATRS